MVLAPSTTSPACKLEKAARKMPWGSMPRCSLNRRSSLAIKASLTKGGMALALSLS